ncbi:TRAP transporter small permease [Halomonas binhaiensis]|uniref:TRAP transporter small permease protein n=2 Tax=Halomonas binhaiensis TaxID=2562282 RepID=A0A5C1NL68_9GAMM|nr:TRAP transporter small permease [Halomonas binhaiensis]
MTDPGMTKPDTIDKTLDGIAHLCLVSAGILLVFLIISFGWLVFGRYVLNDTPTWVEQSALLCVVYITCLGAAAGVRHDMHLKIDMIQEAMPTRFRNAMRQMADLFTATFGVFMAWQGYLLVLDNLDRPVPILGISESWRALPLVICGVLMVVFTINNILRRLTGSITQAGRSTGMED